MNYQQFLSEKIPAIFPSGFDVHDAELNQILFPFQKAIVKWAVKQGRCAVFAGTGMGKTAMQLEWCRQVHLKTGGKVLIVAPLAVAQQTVREAIKFGIEEVGYSRKPSDLPITITNYQMIEHFNPDDYQAVVLDESSIIKHHEGKFRQMLTEMFSQTPYRLCCTATPAPNDHIELGTHSEFLGVMKRHEMLSMYFVHDGGSTSDWRLKGHAVEPFWRWVSSWAVMITKPSDLGFDDSGFDLPSLEIKEHVVGGKKTLALSGSPVVGGLEERREARSASLEARCAKAAEIISADPDEPWLVWCDLNSESDMLRKLIEGSTEIKGSDLPDEKEDRLTGFSEGRYKILVTKPSIAGFGMNWQHCARMIFVGLSDSFEQYYQAVRRCWRFGQTRRVVVHVITGSREDMIVENIKRKESEFKSMQENMISQTHELCRANIEHAVQSRVDYKEKSESGKSWVMRLGDCCELIKDVDSESIDFSIFSPPFASLYTYSSSERDMGNCVTHQQFYDHMKFLAADLFRVTKPGRNLSFHCMNLPTSKCRDGFIGITDFRGDLIRIFQAAGFIYHSEVTIWKDPVTAMQRTKALGLLHKQLKKDACMSRQGIPDYLVTMRKPGNNPNPVVNTNESFPVQEWQEYASPVWMDIKPSKTLQHRSARADEDERHICPLQLEVIERALRLWSNKGDIVLSPFGGIGSEGVVSLQMERRFLGMELKESYWKQAVDNLSFEEAELSKKRLF